MNTVEEATLFGLYNNSITALSAHKYAACKHVPNQRKFSLFSCEIYQSLFFGQACRAMFLQRKDKI